MSKRTLAFALAAGLCATLLIVAFIIAPHACEWGLTVYSWSGGAVTLALAAIPACLLRELRPWKRILATLGLGALGVATWIGGLFAADIQIICRLF
ncbi:MAG: hypothetical protein M3Y70_05035 [Pseudomonadota bacterium]|nr:hypothetical protein [Pseudomonadota bacterium]